LRFQRPSHFWYRLQLAFTRILVIDKTNQCGITWKHNKKLINRHPHIFSNNSDGSYKKESWEATKKKEKNRDSVLDGVPKSLPALLLSRRIQEKAAGVGFDWDNNNQVLDKVDEEVSELKESMIKNEGIDEELGDVLFSLVNLSRHLDIDPELSLKRSTEKFMKRFKAIEKEVDIEKLSLEELDEIWNKNKKDTLNK